MISAADVGSPGDVYGILDALVRRTSLGMYPERPVGGLSFVVRHWKLVVDVDAGDPDGVLSALYPALDGGYVVLGGDIDSTRRKGASQGAVHSTADG